jgi:hypothetical protein
MRIENIPKSVPWEGVSTIAMECLKCGAVTPGGKMLLMRTEGYRPRLELACGARRRGRLCASTNIRPLLN